MFGVRDEFGGCKIENTILFLYSFPYSDGEPIDNQMSFLQISIRWQVPLDQHMITVNIVVSLCAIYCLHLTLLRAWADRYYEGFER